MVACARKATRARQSTEGVHGKHCVRAQHLAHLDAVRRGAGRQIQLLHDGLAAVGHALRDASHLLRNLMSVSASRKPKENPQCSDPTSSLSGKQTTCMFLQQSVGPPKKLTAVQTNLSSSSRRKKPPTGPSQRKAAAHPQPEERMPHDAQRIFALARSRWMT